MTSRFINPAHIQCMPLHLPAIPRRPAPLCRVSSHLLHMSSCRITDLKPPKTRRRRPSHAPQDPSHKTIAHSSRPEASRVPSSLLRATGAASETAAGDGAARRGDSERLTWAGGPNTARGPAHRAPTAADADRTPDDCRRCRHGQRWTAGTAHGGPWTVDGEDDRKLVLVGRQRSRSRER